MEYGDSSPTYAVTSNLEAVSACSSRYLQGAGAYCVSAALQAAQFVKSEIRRGGYVFAFVCLFVCGQQNSKR